MTLGNQQEDTVVISRIPRKRILLAEDSADVAQALCDMLAEFGHEVDHAPDGKEALTRYKPGKYDLVITDYSMPRMNGVELAEIVKRRSHKQPILMITAFAFTIAAFDGRPLPVDAVLRKPFLPKEFQAALVKLFPAKTTGTNTRRFRKTDVIPATPMPVLPTEPTAPQREPAKFA
jgi:CheY-like chemotaxis protein